VNTDTSTAFDVVPAIMIDVAPLRRFDQPLITTIYATRDDWWAAALEAYKRMNIDENFRKEIEQFSS